MTAKFVSFVMVTLGLFLCTLDDGRLAAAGRCGERCESRGELEAKT